MTILDANILIYAVSQGDPKHRAASNWLEQLLSSDERVGLPWVSLWAFVRISTNARLFAKPLSLDRAFGFIDEWVSLPNVVVIQPESRHMQIVKTVADKGQANGPLFSDAVLAALAIEQGARLASTDRDFSRFPSLNWLNPLEP